jgi:ankyrin repeat protein
MEEQNLLLKASQGTLTVNDIKQVVSIENLENDIHDEYKTLYWASCSCPVEVVEAILDRGVDIDAVSGKDNSTALVGAIAYGKLDTVRLLLRRKADARIPTTGNYSALHYAARDGVPNDIIIALIERGADLTLKNSNGQTAADFARYLGNVSTALFIEQFYRPTKSANLLV